MKGIRLIILILFSLNASAQKNHFISLDLSYGNAWYRFYPEKLSSIFIDPYEPGTHGNNLAQVFLDFTHMQKLGRGLWLSSSAGTSLMKLNYSDREAKDGKTYFSSQELFANLRSGIRYYNNEYVSPSFYLEVQAGGGYSYAGGSEKTDYVMGDFYQPGSFVLFYQAAFGFGRAQLFYRSYAPRGLAADNIKIAGLSYSVPL